MLNPDKNSNKKIIKFIDLFCGIGGFRLGALNAFKNNDIEGECVFSCDIDEFARKSYYANFGELPEKDIKDISASIIPNHNLLLAGFPCQPFSIIGNGKGFEDTRGTLFFEIARILQEKAPEAFILENVKRLRGHNGGKTLNTILRTLKNLGYYVDFKVLNALDFGLPQKRERIFIVGSKQPHLFIWPEPEIQSLSLDQILEDVVDKKFYASKNIQSKRHQKHKAVHRPSIWHENKSGNISSYPYSCALRAGASYNYLLVNGERRLTPREMLRLQGFPDSFKIVCSDGQTRKQAGNAVPVPMIEQLVSSLLNILFLNKKRKSGQK